MADSMNATLSDPLKTETRIPTAAILNIRFTLMHASSILTGR